MFQLIYLVVYTVYAIATMSYESAITIILTALAVMLALVTIGIAGLAVWGYIGLRDSVKEAAAQHVVKTMELKLQEYPKAAGFVKLMAEMKAGVAYIDQLKNQVVADAEPKDVVNASKDVVQPHAAQSEKKSQQVSVIEKYPGEESLDASSSSPTSGPVKIDPGPDNS
jgi:hypothetical protein